METHYADDFYTVSLGKNDFHFRKFHLKLKVKKVQQSISKIQFKIQFLKRIFKMHVTKNGLRSFAYGIC